MLSPTDCVNQENMTLVIEPNNAPIRAKERKQGLSRTAIRAIIRAWHQKMNARQVAPTPWPQLNATTKAALQRAQLARKELATEVEESSEHQTAAKEGQPHDATKDKESTQEPSNRPAKMLHPEMYRKWKEFSSRQDFHENCRRYYEEITHEPQVAPKEKVMVVKIDEDQVNAPSEPSAQPPNETTKEPEIASLKVQVARVKGETKEEEKDEAHCEPSPPPPSKDVPPKSRHIHSTSGCRQFNALFMATGPQFCPLVAGNPAKTEQNMESWRMFREKKIRIANQAVANDASTMRYGINNIEEDTANEVRFLEIAGQFTENAAMRNQQYQPQKQSQSMNPNIQQPAPTMPTQYGHNMQQQPQPQQAQNPLGESTKGKHKFLLPLPRRTCSPLQSNGQIHPPSQQPQAPINYQPPMSYQQPSYQQSNYQQPPQPPHYQPPQPPMNYQQQHHQQNGWSQPGHGWGN